MKSRRLLLRCCTLELPTDHGTKRTQMKLSFSANDVQNLRNCPSSMSNTSLIKSAPDQGLNNRRISSRFLLTCFCTNHSYSSFSETSANLLLKLLVFLLLSSWAFLLQSCLVTFDSKCFKFLMNVGYDN